jgi:uncharacterized protein YfaP (DUF2135 family)
MMRPPFLPASAALALALLAAGKTAPPAIAGEPPPSVRIESPRGGQTRERVVAIRGRVTALDVPRVTLVLNGVPLSIPVQGGAFETKQVLAPGENAIRAVASRDGVTVEDEIALYASVPPKDLRITLTWDTAGTDVDLWVTGPDGEKILYSRPQGKAGGTLDVDVTNGYGPETYTQARAMPGTYLVQAHFYGSGPPTRLRVNVVRGEGTPQEERREFRALLLRQGEVAEIGEFVVGR